MWYAKPECCNDGNENDGDFDVANGMLTVSSGFNGDDNDSNNNTLLRNKKKINHNRINDN